MTTSKNAGKAAGRAAALPVEPLFQSPHEPILYGQTQIHARAADRLIRIGREAAPGARVLLEMLAHDEAASASDDVPPLLNGFQRGALLDLLTHTMSTIEAAADELAQHIAQVQEGRS